MTWDRRFIELARLVSTWSKDPSTRVGAVVVDSLRRVLATGYNGFPRGVADTPERYADREIKLSLVVHAEANCVLNAVAPLDGATMYVLKFPCSSCAKLIAQAGVKRVVYESDPHGDWAREEHTTRTLFREAGILLEKLEAE